MGKDPRSPSSHSRWDLQFKTYNFQKEKRTNNQINVKRKRTERPLTTKIKPKPRKQTRNRGSMLSPNFCPHSYCCSFLKVNIPQNFHLYVKLKAPLENFVFSNFNYCPLIWLFCNKGAYKEINIKQTCSSDPL